MPKKAKEMSAKAVAALREQGRFAVGGVTGLYLQIDGNSRSWVLRVVIDGKRRQLGLGPFPEVTLAEARDKAWQRRRARHAPLVAWPGNLAIPQHATTPERPVPLQVTKAESHTFEQCARTYIAAQAPGWKSAKHAAQWSSTLERYAYPVIGKRDVADVSAAHVLEILRPIWATKTETATRVRGRIESILDWAEHKSYRHGKNPARWEKNIEHELPSPAKLRKRNTRHHPALPYTRLGAFMVDLRARPGVSARALEWGILTAARFQEIAGARRSEVDLLLKRWTVPAARMKREIEHVVPLSDEAVALFNSLPSGDGSDLIFPAPQGGELCDAALGAMIDGIHEADVAKGGPGYMDPREGRVATQHGFRSTFRDWGAEVGFFDREILEHAIAHKLKDKAEAAYQRGTMLMKRAYIMQQWGKFCGTSEFRAPEIIAQTSRAA